MKAQTEQGRQQQTIVRKAEKLGVGGVDSSGRVLMTIELELTRKNGEERPVGEGGIRRSTPLVLLSHLADQLTFK